MDQEMVSGLFEDADHARKAVDQLLDASFRADEIGVLLSQKQGAAPVEVKHETGVGAGVVGGGALGGLLGAIGAVLVSVGVLPGVGLGLAAAGPLTAAASGAVGGTTGGGLVGAIGGLGIWKERADLPAELEKGRVLISVPASEDRKEAARTALDAAGAAWIHGV